MDHRIKQDAYQNNVYCNEAKYKIKDKMPLNEKQKSQAQSPCFNGKDGSQLYQKKKGHEAHFFAFECFTNQSITVSMFVEFLQEIM